MRKIPVILILLSILCIEAHAEKFNAGEHFNLFHQTDGYHTPERYIDRITEADPEKREDEIYRIKAFFDYVDPAPGFQIFSYSYDNCPFFRPCCKREASITPEQWDELIEFAKLIVKEEKEIFQDIVIPDEEVQNELENLTTKRIEECKGRIINHDYNHELPKMYDEPSSCATYQGKKSYMQARRQYTIDLEEYARKLDVCQNVFIQALSLEEIMEIVKKKDTKLCEEGERKSCHNASYYEGKTKKLKAEMKREKADFEKRIKKNKKQAVASSSAEKKIEKRKSKKTNTNRNGFFSKMLEDEQARMMETLASKERFNIDEAMGKDVYFASIPGTDKTYLYVKEGLKPEVKKRLIAREICHAIERTYEIAVSEGGVVKQQNEVTKFIDEQIKTGKAAKEFSDYAMRPANKSGDYREIMAEACVNEDSGKDAPISKQIMEKVSEFVIGK